MIVSEQQKCYRTATSGGKRAECEQCENWFNEKCQNIDNHIGAKMNDKVWFCSDCQKFNKLDSEPETRIQLSERYVDETRFTVIGEWENLLGNVNTFHRNLEITIKGTYENGLWQFYT